MYKRQTDTLERKSISSVDIYIEDVKTNISLINNSGEKTIQLSEPEVYKIKCGDNSFRSNPVVQVEAI